MDIAFKGLPPTTSGVALFDRLADIGYPQPWPGPTAVSSLLAHTFAAIGEHLGDRVDAWRTYLVLAPQSEVSAIELAEAIGTLQSTDRPVRATDAALAEPPQWMDGATALMIAVEVPDGMARAVFEIASAWPHHGCTRNLHRSNLLPDDVTDTLASLPARATELVAKLQRDGITREQIDALAANQRTKTVVAARRAALLRLEAQQYALAHAPEVLARFEGRSVELVFSNRGRLASLWGKVTKCDDGMFELDSGPLDSKPVPQIENLRGIRDDSSTGARLGMWRCQPNDITTSVKRSENEDASTALFDIAMRVGNALTDEQMSTLQQAADILATMRVDKRR